MKSRGCVGWAFFLIALMLVSNPTSIPPDFGSSVSTQSFDDDSTMLEDSFLSSALNMGDIIFNVTSSSSQFDGYNLFALHQLSRIGQPTNHATLFTYMDGNVLDTAELHYPVEWINSTTLMARSFTDTNSYLYNYYTEEYTVLPFDTHHELEYNEGSNTIFLLERYYTDINGTDYRFDYIHEKTLDGATIWTVDIGDFVNYTMWCPYEDIYLGAADVTHANSIFFEPDEDALYVNVRNVDTFYKIDHATGDVIWGLGKYGNFTLYDIYGNEKDALFYHAHSVEKVDEDTYILFDNDLHNHTDPNNELSRLVEITVDEDTMTANETWVWTAPHSYYSDSRGDADRLPNGNRLGTFGTPTHNHPTTIGARLVEVDPEGNIVWEMNFPQTDISQYQIYRMERFRFSPILSEPVDFETVHTSATVSWDTWYNFRPKRNMTGSYELYLNDVMVNSGSVIFDKYWRPVDLSILVESLAVGYNNVTLAVYDEGGHKTTDTVGVTRVGLIVEHDGPNDYELGDLSDRNFTWYGATAISYSCNVTVNGTLYTSTIWDGTNVTVDLQTLDPGNNEIALLLYNVSGTAYEESVWVSIHPTEVPVITPNQLSLVEIDFMGSLNLTWGIFDNSPARWEVWLEGSLDAEGVWPIKSYLVNYPFPWVSAGVYNVTLRVFDSLGQSAVDQLTVIVNSVDGPIITSSPSNTTLKWGGVGKVLTWDVYFASDWTLLRNGTTLAEGTLVGHEVEFVLENWLEENWQLGNYNLTLYVTDGELWVTSTVWIEIVLEIVDPYADELIESMSRYYFFGENAIDAPDGEYATIFLEYTGGYVTLDMGEGEEIVDGTGDDFEVVVGVGGTYTVYVTNDIDGQFTMVDRTSGNSSFDLSSTELDMVRYVRVEYFSGADVTLDAIVAINLNQQMSDTEAPVIEAIADYWVLVEESSTTLTWEVYDLTPWSYTIYVNGVLNITEVWDGSDIVFVLEPLTVGVWNVTLVVEDAFDNIATDSVSIEVFENTPTDPFGLITLAIVGGVAAVGVVFGLAFYLNRKKGLA